MIKRIKNNAFARNSIILFIGTMAASVLNYFFHVGVGRMVSTSVYGEVESLISLTAIISVPSASLAMVATKLGACNKAEEDISGSLQVLEYLNKKIFIYGLPIFFALALFSSYFKNFLQIESVWPLFIVWLMMLLSFFSAVTGGLLNGWQKFESSSWAGIWGAFVKLASAILLIKLGFDLNGAIGGFALGALAAYAFSIYFLKNLKKENHEKKEIKRIDKHLFKVYMWPIFWGNLAITILANVDMVLAKHNLSPDMAGQYGALSIISKIIFFATGIVGTVLFSMTAENNYKKNSSTKTLIHALYLMAIISIPAFIFYYLFPGFIISILFGSKYPDAGPYLWWFAVSVILFSFANLFFQYLLSLNKTKVAYILLAISILASLAILFVGTSIFVIIAIMIVAQLVAAASGLYFILKRPVLL
ncbi:MAG TPA: oligosaccharide flippase family protein [Patescibacteria group bacterium]|nr:oligosaccharide flippase family protein [Patescibacteria group bacterium]